jgi:hypothetical protein
MKGGKSRNKFGVYLFSVQCTVVKENDNNLYGKKYVNVILTNAYMLTNKPIITT